MITKRAIFLQWCDSRIIPRSKISPALHVSGILPTSRDWQWFIDRLLLWTGIMSLTFSVIFFFAYNWDFLGRLSKFSLIEASILLTLFCYWKFGPDSTAGKSSLTMAAILFGGLLALFGQIYQTGADPWQLFASWSLLILPWVAIACFVPLWLIWIGLVNLSLYLYFSIFPSFWGLLISFAPLLFILFLFNTFVLVLWEITSRHIAWLQQRWAIRFIAVLSGSAITSLIVQAVFDSHSYNSSWSFYGIYPVLYASLYAAWIAGFFFFYRCKIQDLFMLAGMCLSLIIVVTALLGRALLNHSDAGGFLLIAMAVIAMSAASAMWLKRVNEEMNS